MELEEIPKFKDFQRENLIVKCYNKAMRKEENLYFTWLIFNLHIIDENEKGRQKNHLPPSPLFKKTFL